MINIAPILTILLVWGLIYVVDLIFVVKGFKYIIFNPPEPRYKISNKVFSTVALIIGVMSLVWATNNCWNVTNIFHEFSSEPLTIIVSLQAFLVTFAVITIFNLVGLFLLPYGLKHNSANHIAARILGAILIGTQALAIWEFALNPYTLTDWATYYGGLFNFLISYGPILSNFVIGVLVIRWSYKDIKSNLSTQPDLKLNPNAQS